MLGSTSIPIPSKKFTRPILSIISPHLSCSSALSAQKSIDSSAISTSLSQSSCDSNFMKGTITVPIKSPIFKVLLPPIRTVAPLSSPG